MSVDLIKHTINGVVPTELPAEPITMEHIENLYIIYRDSVPHSSGRYSKYFVSKRLEELSTEDLASNVDRKTAQKDLETAVLYAIMRKDITFPDENNWFWQSERVPELVLFKQWFN